MINADYNQNQVVVNQGGKVQLPSMEQLHNISAKMAAVRQQGNDSKISNSKSFGSDSFEAFLQSHNYLLPPHLIQDGKIHRFGKNDRLWYVCEQDWGCAGDWSGELGETITWQDKLTWHNYSAGDRENNIRKIESAREAAREESLF